MKSSIAQRLCDLNWTDIRAALFEHGYAVIPQVLTQDECADLAAVYHSENIFRSHIIMARYRFGRGDYKYFDYPLPTLVQELREHSYSYLAPIANDWNQALEVPDQFPEKHSDFIRVCRNHGQTRATPLLLHYEEGDFNCLHQDLYGAIAFPLQMTCFLSRAGVDFEGGEFVLVEQQPRAQSKAEVINPRQGEAVVFTTRYRPVKGNRGYYRTNLRHGVSRVKQGVRFTLGVIYHDAE